MLLRKPTLTDILEVSYNLRDSDRAELEAVGIAPEFAVGEAVSVSDKRLCWAVIDGDRAVGAAGCARLNDDVGVAWLLTAKGFGMKPRDVLVLSKAAVAAMHSRYSVLFNWIDNRNLRSMRWLRSIGFFPAGVNPNYAGSGLPFTCYVSLRHV